jgi:hypothetical protein
MRISIRYCTLHELQVLFSQINYDIASHEIKRILEEAGDYSPVFTMRERIKWSHNHRCKARGYPEEHYDWEPRQ